MNRVERTRLAEATLAIIRSGQYAAPSGARVDLSADLSASVEGTRVIRPSDWEHILINAKSTASNAPAEIEVTGESTLAAALRMAGHDCRADVAVLNFASAKNPGGGFLSGSQAQEESLARSSALYATLETAGEYYNANRNCGNTLYTDHAIFSPRVPVFRDDTGGLLERHYLVSFITMPAVNVGAIKPGSPHRSRVPSVMRRRIDYVLALAASTGHRALVLGAWGCGVFRNDPDQIAALFAQALNEGNAPWRACFDRIIFAVLDTTLAGANRRPFERYFGDEAK